MQYRQRGFTLIELVVVIVILGVLAATAAPRFVDFKDDAEMAVFETLGPAMLAAADMAHLKYTMAGLPIVDADGKSYDTKAANTQFTINGEPIRMVRGYPHDDSIGKLVDHEGFTWQPSTGWFVWNAVNNNNCRHDYNYAGWRGNPTDDKPGVVITRSGCR